MIRQYRSSQGSRYSTDDALKTLDKIADRLLRSNQECLIPETELMGHDAMNNCHVIAEGFLALISNERGEVLCWPTSTRSIGREAQRAIAEGQFETNPPAIFLNHYEPVCRSKNHKDVKFTFACSNHDNKVFKPLDSVQQFNSEDKETRFMLALRAIATYTAWYRGHKRWSQHDFKKDRGMRRILNDYPGLQRTYNAISEWGTREIAAERKLEAEMKRWKSAYLRSAWQLAATKTEKITPKVRIAAIGISSPWGYPVAMTILPAANGDCLVLATSLESKTPAAWLSQIGRRFAVRKVAKHWSKELEEMEPKEWLPTLAQQCEFLYVSPHDYYKDDIINSEERREIEREMFSKNQRYGSGVLTRNDK